MIILYVFSNLFFTWGVDNFKHLDYTCTSIIILHALLTHLSISPVGELSINTDHFLGFVWWPISNNFFFICESPFNLHTLYILYYIICVGNPKVNLQLVYIMYECQTSTCMHFIFYFLKSNIFYLWKLASSSVHILFFICVCLCLTLYFLFLWYVHLAIFFCLNILYGFSQFVWWQISVQTSWSENSCNHLINNFHIIEICKVKVTYELVG